MNSRKKVGKLLGNLESEVMEILWQSQTPVSVRYVTEILQKKRKIAYTTVMTIMTRLVEKGVLNRKLNGVSYLYQPKIAKEQFVARSVHNIFTTTVLALGQEAVTHFIEEIQKLSPRKRQQLLKILDNKIK